MGEFNKLYIVIDKELNDDSSIPSNIIGAYLNQDIDNIMNNQLNEYKKEREKLGKTYNIEMFKFVGNFIDIEHLTPNNINFNKVANKNIVSKFINYFKK
jgi:hypothetical protein